MTVSPAGLQHKNCHAIKSLHDNCNMLKKKMNFAVVARRHGDLSVHVAQQITSRLIQRTLCLNCNRFLMQTDSSDQCTWPFSVSLKLLLLCCCCCCRCRRRFCCSVLLSLVLSVVRHVKILSHQSNEIVPREAGLTCLD